MTRGRLDHGPDWFCSDAADAAIDAVLANDPRRSWDPRWDTPSLASLKGRAAIYGGRYEASRAALLDKAGVTVRVHYARRTGAVAYIVTMPGEPLGAACWADRTTATLRHASERPLDTGVPAGMVGA